MRASAKSILCTLLVLWAAGVGAGVFGLWRFDGTPGRAANPAAAWPAASPLARIPGRFTLVMLLHPNCPCSRASLDDLAELLAHSADRVTAYAVFVEAPGLPADPATSDLWKTAAAMSNVTPVKETPAEVQDFRAETSGTVCLYDPAGVLRFHGGITPSRGHTGENSGSASIEALLSARTTITTQCPVYGCPLQ